MPGCIEPKFHEQMNRHGLQHAPCWGLAKGRAQLLLNVITVSAKRIVKLLNRVSVPGPVSVAVEVTP